MICLKRFNKAYNESLDGRYRVTRAKRFKFNLEAIRAFKVVPFQAREASQENVPVKELK